MAKETYARLSVANPQTAMAILASGRNPDATSFLLDVVSLRTVVLGSITTAIAASSVADAVGTSAAPVDVSMYRELDIVSTFTAGQPVVELGWSRASATAPDFYEVLTAAGTNVPVLVRSRFPFLHARVRNTDVVNALAGHRTTVVGV